MAKLLKRGLFILIALFALYAVAWYSWGLFIKNSISGAMNASDKYQLTAEKIELAGFPFALNYNLKNLVIASKDEANKMAIKFPESSLKFDLRLKKMNFANISTILITPPDNKQSYEVNFLNGADLKLLFDKGCAYEIFKSAENPFVFENFKEVSYSDAGYAVKDTILEKIIFNGDATKINLSFKTKDNIEELQVIAKAKAKATEDYSIMPAAAFDLDTDFIVKMMITPKDQTKRLDGIGFNFKQFVLNLDNSSLSLNGDLTMMNSTATSEGLVELKINNLANFINLIAQTSSEKKAEYLKALLQKMAGTEPDQPLENLHIQIKSEDRALKFGNATIVDLLLYSMHG